MLWGFLGTDHCISRLYLHPRISVLIARQSETEAKVPVWSIEDAGTCRYETFLQSSQASWLLDYVQVPIRLTPSPVFSTSGETLDGAEGYLGSRTCEFSASRGLFLEIFLEKNFIILVQPLEHEPSMRSAEGNATQKLLSLISH